MNKHSIRFVLFCLPVALFFFSCAGQAQKRSCLLDSEINIADFDERLYNYRTWYPPADLPFNPIGFGKQVDIPVNQAKTKRGGQRW